MAEKKKTERKTEGHSHWAKGSMRMPLFLACICCFRRENGKGGGFASCRGKSRGKGVCAVLVPLVLLGDAWDERRCRSTEEGRAEKTATSATGRERTFLPQKEDTGCYFPVSSCFTWLVV